MTKKAPKKYPHKDVVVAGGGIVGMCLSLLLSHHLPKHKIALIERHAGPVDTPPNRDDRDTSTQNDHRTTALSAGSIDILRTLDTKRRTTPSVAETIEASATPIRSVQVSDQGHIGWTQHEDTHNHGRPLGYVIENHTLLSILRNALASRKNVRLYAPANLTNVTMTRGGAAVMISQESKTISLSTSLLVIADGAESTLAKKLGIGFDIHDYDQWAIVASIDHTLAHNGHAFERFTEKGPIAMLPLGGTHQSRRSSLIWTHSTSRIKSVAELNDKAFLDALSTQFGGRLGQLIHIGKRAHYPLRRVRAKEQVRSSLVLMGNAAHSLHPVAGQGLNLSLRDAQALCCTLAQRAAEEIDDATSANTRQTINFGDIRHLNAYYKQREQDQSLTIQASHQLIAAFSSSDVGARASRSLGLCLINHAHPIRSLFFRQMMGITNTAWLRS